MVSHIKTKLLITHLIRVDLISLWLKYETSQHKHINRTYFSSIQKISKSKCKSERKENIQWSKLKSHLIISLKIVLTIKISITRKNELHWMLKSNDIKNIQYWANLAKKLLDICFQSLKGESWWKEISFSWRIMLKRQLL